MPLQIERMVEPALSIIASSLPYVLMCALPLSYCFISDMPLANSLSYPFCVSRLSGSIQGDGLLIIYPLDNQPEAK